MMWDRIFRLFLGPKKEKQVDCCAADKEEAEKTRLRHELERREREAKRMNDALENIVRTIQQD